MNRRLHLEHAHELSRRHLHALIGAWQWRQRLDDDEFADELRASLAALRGLRELLEAEPPGDVALLSLGPYAAKSATAS